MTATVLANVDQAVLSLVRALEKFVEDTVPTQGEFDSVIVDLTFDDTSFLLDIGLGYSTFNSYSRMACALAETIVANQTGLHSAEGMVARRSFALAIKLVADNVVYLPSEREHERPHLLELCAALNVRA